MKKVAMAIIFTIMLGATACAGTTQTVLSTPSVAPTQTVSETNADKAYRALAEALTDKIAEWNRRVSEGSTIKLVATGEEVINGANCWTFALGTDSPEKFTAEEHYAVNESGEVYILDILSGEYSPYDPAAQTALVDNSQTYIGMMTQEYIGGNIAEIPMIMYDGQQVAFEEYGFRNPEIEPINNVIKNGIQQEYNAFIESADAGVGTIEIRLYPFTTDDMLQVVVTHIQYPIYGTDGELFTVNFDKANNHAVYAEDIMAERGLTEDGIAERAAELYIPESDGMSISNVAVKGFLKKGEDVAFLLEADVENTEADTWKHFFTISPDYDELIQLNGECLFDPALLDVMDPPLVYGQDKTLSLEFDTTGLDVIIPDAEYSLDGLVYYKVERLTSAEYGEDTVRAKVADLENINADGIEISSLSEPPENISSYPVWKLSYTTGSNEDTSLCVDIYIQTDGADYRFHAVVDADYEADYAADLAKRVNSLCWSE